MNNPTLIYEHEGYTIALRLRSLAWVATVQDDGNTLWSAAGFQDKEVAKKAAENVIANIMKKKETQNGES